MYKQFGPEEMKEAEEFQSLDQFLNARGYVVIKRKDLLKTFMNMINGVPETKAEKDLKNIMKKHPVESLLIASVLIDIEKRLFKGCP